MDYKLRLCFIGLDPFFKSSQPALSFFSSFNECLRSKLSFIKVHRLGQMSLNLRQSCPFHYFLLQDFISEL